MKISIFFLSLLLISNNLSGKIKHSDNKKNVKSQLKIEIIPPDKIIEGMPASFRINLKNPHNLIIIPVKGYTLYGNVYKQGKNYYYDMLIQKETDPIFFNVLKDLTLIEERFFSKTGKMNFEWTMQIFHPSYLKPEHLFIAKKSKTNIIPFKKLKNFYGLKRKLIKASYIQVLIPDGDKIPKLQLKAEVEINVLEAKEISPFKKKYNPKSFRFFPELNLWAFFLKEKTILLKDEKGSFIEIPAGKTDENALSLLCSKKETFLIWVIPKEGCIQDFLNKYGRSNKGVDGDQMYHGDANFQLNLPRDEFFDFITCVDKDGYIFTTHSYASFASAELWVRDKEKSK